MEKVVNLFPSKRNCDFCDARGSVVLVKENENVSYGDGKSKIETAVEIPAWRCESCGVSYTDGSAEEVRHAAICRALGLLSPKEIVGIRDRYGLTQSDFARISGIGEASIKRWESGRTIQNLSNDRLLRLMRDPKVFASLRSFADRLTPEPQSVEKFRTHLTERQRRASEQFQLRYVG